MGHTPQSLRDSSPNLGEQLAGAGAEANTNRTNDTNGHTPQSLRDSSPNIGERHKSERRKGEEG